MQNGARSFFFIENNSPWITENRFLQIIFISDFFQCESHRRHFKEKLWRRRAKWPGSRNRVGCSRRQVKNQFWYSTLDIIKHSCLRNVTRRRSHAKVLRNERVRGRAREISKEIGKITSEPSAFFSQGVKLCNLSLNYQQINKQKYLYFKVFLPRPFILQSRFA